ncbi:MAG: hypothetical protein LBQ34_03520 [Alphaproteobacteria bacterium]|jgi:hypothetical protein|nr:hypothetical protein [Alphaproteobacteria bacterium]
MQIFFRLIFLGVFLLLAACSSHKSILDDEIAKLKSNTVEEKSLKELEVSESSNDYLLFMQELARIYFIKDDVDNALLYGKKSTDYYNRLDEKAVLAGGRVGSGLLAATLGNDNNLDYTGSDYERAFDYFYSSINYLKKNDLNSALIDIRATSDIQKLAVARREARIAAAHDKINKTNYTLSADTKAILDKNSRMLADTQSGFLNAYIYYISGNIRELSGDLNGAMVDYKLALSINPTNRYILQDAMRLAKLIDSSYYQSLKGSVEEVADYKQKATVIVVYEQGFIPAKQEFRGTIWLFDGSFYTIALPYYPDSGVKPNTVMVDFFKTAGESQRTKMEVLTDVYTLAQNDLAENYPFIMARQVSRVISKGVAQNVGRNMMNGNNNNNAGLGLLMYGVGAMSSVLESADTRSFRVLPHYVQVAKFNSSQNINKLKILVNSNRSIEIADISVNLGETALVYVVDTGNYIYSKVVFKSRKT